MDKKITGKYRSPELADLIMNLNDFRRGYMTIIGGGSLEEWAYYFQLDEQGITTKGLLKFLKAHGCFRYVEKNLIELDHENLLQLHIDLRCALGQKDFIVGFLHRFRV